jgi:hypothetical protein
MFTGMTSLYLNQMLRLEEQRRQQIEQLRQDYVSPRDEVNATVSGLWQTVRSWFGRRPQPEDRMERRPAPSCDLTMQPR